MRQFFLFLLSGGTAAALNWGSRFFFSNWLPFGWAVAAAYVVGMVSAFLLMRYFVFDGKQKEIRTQATRFLLINILALMQTILISVFLAKWALPKIGLIQNADAIGHFFGVLFPVLTSYIGHKRWSFR